MPTTTLYLQRETGIEELNVTWNGNVEVVETKPKVLAWHRLLFEMEPDERAERLAELGAYHAE